MKTVKFILISVAVLLIAIPANAVTYKMRITHQLPENHHIGQDINFFKSLVEKKSGGRMEIEVYPASQAFKPKDVIPAVVQNSIEAGETTNFEWAGMLPIMDVVLIPWLVTDLSTIEKTIDGEAGAILFKAIESKGVVPLMWLLQCRTNMYSSNNAPLIMPNDFKGKKMRGTSKIMNLGSEALGAVTMPISGPEVYTALQRGTIDIGLTGIDTAYARHIYEVQKFGTVVNNFTVMHPFFVNPTFWNSLPADLQKTVRECARETQARSIQDSEKARTEAIAQLKQKMTVHLQTPEEEKAWKAVMEKPVLDYFLSKTGDEGKHLVEIIRKSGK
jgi:TRAP-type C4-dicarboxylate transport system substrate-binding protein